MIPKYARYNYCIAKSIDFLLNENIKNFPYDSDPIINKHKWSRLKYSQLATIHDIEIKDVADTYGSNDGYSIFSGRNYTIAYNDNQLPKRIYFTKLHEIGHIYLNHFLDFKETIINRSNMSGKEYKVLENEANCFARNVIAPAVIVKYLNLDTPQKIASYFAITETAARTRLDLLDLDYKYINDINKNRLLSFWNDSIYKNCCLKCGHGFISNISKYCPVCGHNRLTWGDKKMIYDSIQLQENGKAIICPTCNNEYTSISGEYCQICGTHITNICTSCEAVLSGEARYCPYCGSQSTFFTDDLLRDWEIVKKEEDAVNSFLGVESKEYSNYTVSTPEEDFSELPF